MGRPPSPLAADALEAAIAYLQRAADRGADIFTRGSKETKRSLATLRRQALSLRRPDFAAEANAWLGEHVTPAGRRAMLTALRQQRLADERSTEGTGRSLRLSAVAQADVAKLAELLGMSWSATVALVAKAALADKDFLATLPATAGRDADQLQRPLQPAATPPKRLAQ